MKTRNLIGYPVAVFVAFLIGTGAGASTQVAADAPAPQVVTKEVVKVMRLPAKTVTKTVTKEVTPPVCLRALDKADAAFVKAGEGFAAASDALTAVIAMDAVAMEKGTKTLADVGEYLADAAPSYKAAELACQNAAAK